ncbi:MAG: SDR family NAD(P)-dependent oxidoreductase [Microscillaceae bacterium]
MAYQLSLRYPQKRAFVTGAASGLGWALCQKLAHEGWQLGLADVNAQKLEEARQMVLGQGGQAWVFPLDVSDREAYARVAAEFLQKAGGIDLLFNNAGVGDGGKVGEYSLENWEWMIGINQMGVIYGCHFFVPVMQAQQSGHIINTASAAAIASAPGMASYNVTKAAVVSLSETLHTELQDFNIKVSCVMPWFFKTNIIQYARGGEEVRRMGQKAVEESPYTAEEVAEIVLQKVGAQKFYVVVTKEAKSMWWMKRFFPQRFFRLVKRMYDQQQAEVAQLSVQTPASSLVEK